MATEACVACGQQEVVGAPKCRHCGADWPHRQRAVKAEALAKRRRLVLAGVLAGAVLLAFFVTRSGGGESRECRDYDAAQSRYDDALGGGADPADPEIVTQQAEVERLRLACRG